MKTHFTNTSSWSSEDISTISISPIRLHCSMKTYWGNGYIDKLVLDLSTGRRWVISFTPWPLYHRGKIRRYPLDRRLGEPQNWSGQREEEKILAFYRDSNSDPSAVQPVAISYTEGAHPTQKSSGTVHKDKPHLSSRIVTNSLFVVLVALMFIGPDIHAT
jgi:hypothetical protein